MSYLNCPFCPAQAFPVIPEKGTLQIRPDLVLYRCVSKHHFYVDKEREKEI